MRDFNSEIRQAIAGYDRAALKDYLLKGEQHRSEIVSRFPLESWSALPQERYALDTVQLSAE